MRLKSDDGDDNGNEESGGRFCKHLQEVCRAVNAFSDAFTSQHFMGEMAGDALLAFFAMRQ